jgi:TPR repeat protein
MRRWLLPAAALLLIATAIGVRVWLPEVGPASGGVALPTETEREATTDGGPPLRTADAISDAVTGFDDETESDLSPLEAEQERFMTMLDEVIGGRSGDPLNPSMPATVAEIGGPRLLAELEQLWESGQPVAGLVIARLLSNPRYGMHDPANARLWLERAADAGSLAAGITLASELLDNDPTGADYDPSRATDLLEHLLADGVLEVAPRLLRVHAGSEAESGYPGDAGRVDALVALINESGDGELIDQLGLLYDEGFGGPDSDALAVDAFELAGENGASGSLQTAALILTNCPSGESNDANRAIALAQRQIELYGDTVSSGLTLARAYALAGRWTDAIQVLQELIARGEASGEANGLDMARARLTLYQRSEVGRPDYCDG